MDRDGGVGATHDTWRQVFVAEERGSAYEHESKFYHVEIPPQIKKVKVPIFIIHVSRNFGAVGATCDTWRQVVVVPLEGDPDLYVSFDAKLPSGATNATFVQVFHFTEYLRTY